MVMGVVWMMPPDEAGALTMCSYSNAVARGLAARVAERCLAAVPIASDRDQREPLQPGEPVRPGERATDGRGQRRHVVGLRGPHRDRKLAGDKERRRSHWPR